MIPNITDNAAIQEARNIKAKYEQQNQQMEMFLEKFDEFNKRHKIHKFNANCLNEIINLKIDTKNQDIILSKMASTTIPIMITMETQELLSSAKKKNGVDIICVLDNSGSMREQKMRLLKETIHFIIESLSEKDRLSLIKFSYKGTLLCDLLPVNEQNCPILRKIIDDLGRDGGTNIISGMEVALNVIKNRTNIGNVTAIFALSDGQDQYPNEAISTFEQSLYQKQIKDNFVIQSFGFGSDHDPVLMRSFAEYKNGSFYYIGDLELIEECFADALSGVSSVIAQNGLIQVQLEHPAKFSDLRINKTYGNQ